MKPPVIVSACLLGLNTRYDGTNKEDAGLLQELAGRHLIPVCPEQLGGLPTPRPPSSLGGASGEQVLTGHARVRATGGDDVTIQFIRGANEVLRLAQLFGVKEAYLKDGSPSCGLSSFHGVCAAALIRHGVEVHAVS